MDTFYLMSILRSFCGIPPVMLSHIALTLFSFSHSGPDTTFGLSEIAFLFESPLL